jgi:Tfp pilus assembly protein PilV
MKGRGGFALLEALLALAILGTAGLSLVALVRAGLASEQRAREQERAMATASRVLTAMTLLTRPELDQRLGMHAVGEFAVEVQRPERTLYRLALRVAATPSLETLVTVVYRP